MIKLVENRCKIVHGDSKTDYSKNRTLNVY